MGAFRLLCPGSPAGAWPISALACVCTRVCTCTCAGVFVTVCVGDPNTPGRARGPPPGGAPPEVGAWHAPAPAEPPWRRGSREGVVPEHADGLGALPRLQQRKLHADGPLQGAGQRRPLAVHHGAHHRRVDDRPAWQPAGSETQGHACQGTRLTAQPCASTEDTGLMPSGRGHHCGELCSWEGPGPWPWPVLRGRCSAAGAPCGWGVHRVKGEL